MTNSAHQRVDLRSVLESSLEKTASQAFAQKLEIGYLVDDDAPDAVVSNPQVLQNILVSLLEFCIRNVHSGFVQISARTLLLYGNLYQLRITIKGAPDENPAHSDAQRPSSPPPRTRQLEELMAYCSRQAVSIAGRMTMEEGQESGYCFHLSLQTESASMPLASCRESFQPLLHYRQALILSPHMVNRELLLQQSKCWGMITRAFAKANEIPEDLLQPGAFDLAVIDSYWPLNEENLGPAPSDTALPEDLPVILCDCPGGQYPVVFQSAQVKARLAKPIVPSRLYEALIHLLS